jgi:CMP-N,N'-diacetyllegionaminic acid synthase
MKILGIIPARSGSKGVKNKNIRKLNNKYLIDYTIIESLKSNLTDVIVSTNSLKITKIVKDLGGNAPFLRPKNLAADNSSSISVVQHAIVTYSKITGLTYDAIMLLQPTCPLRTSLDINNSIDLFISKNPDSVISVYNVNGLHPARMKYLDNNNYLIDPPFAEKIENQPRQELKPMYIRNGAIYLTKLSEINKGTFKGNKSLAYIMDADKSINIDTEFDFKLAEMLLTT